MDGESKSPKSSKWNDLLDALRRWLWPFGILLSLWGAFCLFFSLTSSGRDPFDPAPVSAFIFIFVGAYPLSLRWTRRPRGFSKAIVVLHAILLVGSGALWIGSRTGGAVPAGILRLLPGIGALAAFSTILTSYGPLLLRQRPGSAWLRFSFFSAASYLFAGAFFLFASLFFPSILGPPEVRMPRGELIGLLLILPPVVGDCLSGTLKGGSGRGRVSPLTLVALIACAGFVASGYAALWTNLRLARTSAGKNIAFSGEQKAQEIDEHLQAFEVTARLIGRGDFPGTEELDAWAANPRGFLPEGAVRLFRTLIEGGRVETIIITDSEGKYLYPTRDGRADALVAALGPFDPDQGRAFVSMAVVGTAGDLRYGWAQRLKRSGAIVFLLRNPNTAMNSILSRWPSSSKTGEFFLVRRHADLVQLQSPLRFEDSDSFMTLGAPRPIDLTIKDSMADAPGLLKAVDYRNEAVVIHIQAIPGTSWELVTKIDEREFFSDYRKLLYGFFQTLASGIALVGLGLFLQFRWQKNQVAMERLRERAERGWLMEAIDRGSDGIIIVNLPEQRILYMNRSAGEALGIGTAPLSGMSLPSDAFIAEDGRRLDELFGSIEHEGLTETLRGTLRNVGGGQSAVEIKLERVEFHGGRALLIQGRDIAERVAAEREREASLRLMAVVNHAVDIQSLTEGLLTCIMECADCEAVGIRLRDGDDYPYYCHSGFGEGFIMAEKSLCKRDPSGAVVKDSDGKPVLECMCGAIIRGHLDTSLPFITKGGSFWSNCITDHLASLSPDERKDSCGRLMGKGYESVALIPLRSAGETFGLIQLSDRRKDRFTKRFMEFMERMASDAAQGIRAIRASEELRKSEGKYRSLFESMAYGFALHEIILNAEGKPVDYRFLEVNPAFERLTGLKASSLVGRTVMEVMPHTEPYWVEAYGRVALGGGILRMENYSGELGKHFEVTAYSPERGKFAVLVADVSERKRIEAELLEAKEKAAVILASVGEGVIATDVLGVITAMNGAAERLCGWTEARALGRGLEEVFSLVNESGGDVVPLDLADLIEGRKARMSVEARLVDRSGRKFPISYSVAPIMDGRGSIRGMVVSFRDISESLLLLQAAQRAEKLEALSTMAGGIAHDFNNLLGGIFGYLDIARKEIDPASPVTVFLEKAVGVFNRARDLSLQLLTFSKGGAARRKPGYPARVAAESASFSLSGSKLRLALDLPDDLWPCDFDANQFQQVIQNLVINAKQAMPDGGSLILSGANRSYSEGGPEGLPPGDYLELSVRDDGPGIPAEFLGKIFDPFFTTKKEGSGLGLATSYSIMERHGGKILVHSELGSGTVFTLYLPALPGATVEDASDASVKVRGRGRILLMDDEECILEVLSMMLEELGFTCDSCTEGSQALALARKASTDGKPYMAAFLDLTIPDGLGGLAIVAELKKEMGGGPVIASSGYSEDPVMADPGKYGFDAALMKPYLGADLMAVLAEVMKKRS